MTAKSNRGKKSRSKQEAKPSLMARLSENDPTLTHVRLNNKKLGKATSLLPLVDALKTNTHVTKLELGGNYFGDAIRADRNPYVVCRPTPFVEILASHPSIEHFVLWNNDLDDDAAEIVARAVRGNRKIKKLDLSMNEIGDNGARQLAACLRHNATLTELELFGNCIGKHGSEEFLDVLRSGQNATIAKLSLWGQRTRRPDASSAAVEAFLFARNARLARLDVGLCYSLYPLIIGRLHHLDVVFGFVRGSPEMCHGVGEAPSRR